MNMSREERKSRAFFMEGYKRGRKEGLKKS